MMDSLLGSFPVGQAKLFSNKCILCLRSLVAFPTEEVAVQRVAVRADDRILGAGMLSALICTVRYMKIYRLL